MAGNNLHVILGYYYGDARQWERIWQAYRDQIPNPNRIGRGTLLRIPDPALPTDSYTDFLTRIRRVVTLASGPARSEVGRPSEVEDQASGETPPASESPWMEPTTRPGPRVPAGPSGRPGASTGPSDNRP